MEACGSVPDTLLVALCPLVAWLLDGSEGVLKGTGWVLPGAEEALAAGVTLRLSAVLKTVDTDGPPVADVIGAVDVAHCLSTHAEMATTCEVTGSKLDPTSLTIGVAGVLVCTPVGN